MIKSSSRTILVYSTQSTYCQIKTFPRCKAVQILRSIYPKCYKNQEKIVLLSILKGVTMPNVYFQRNDDIGETKYFQIFPNI